MDLNAEGTAATLMMKKVAANTDKGAGVAKQVDKLAGRLDHLTLKILDGTVPQDGITSHNRNRIQTPHWAPQMSPSQTSD
ncbi:hypothetical protein ACIQC0_02225 [Pseudarthrobacter sp. NPDC092419]|uniref:hypothetical protein n=1 Tax=Pseudarthrobacter sp. NPDC092419 TaxID=3364414 RepID=UPI003815B3CA